MNPEPNSSAGPLGTPLEELFNLLTSKGLGVTRAEGSLRIEHAGCVVRISAVASARNVIVADKGPIEAVVQVRTQLPPDMAAMIGTAERVAPFNTLATLGALTLDEGQLYVGSRVTKFLANDAWRLFFPLLYGATVEAASSLLSAMHMAFDGGPAKTSKSAWSADDLEQVRAQLAPLCTCTTSGLGLAADFELPGHEHAHVAGHRHVALWQMRADELHPVMKGGLLCLLEMPQRIGVRSRLEEVLNNLNRLEMTPADLPPHFGAWCPGNLGNNLAYTSFVPNWLHSVNGVAVNMSTWAMARALWANDMLRSWQVGD